MGRPFPPLKIAAYWGYAEPHLIRGSLSLPESLNGISIGVAGFAGLTSVTDRQTDRPSYSVGNNGPRLRTAMRPNDAVSNCDLAVFVLQCP